MQRSEFRAARLFVALTALLACLATVDPLPSAPVPPGAGDAVLARHNAWVAGCYKEIRAIKPGMTRADLLKRFQPAGGLYRRTLQSYAYKPCPYFKISVTFEAVGGDKDGKGRPGDKIVKVATPYLEDPFAE
jgi:hypothetical protein